MIAVAAPPQTRKVLIVTDQIPGHEAGFTLSGHARYLASFLDHFRTRGFAVTLVALRPRLDVASIRMAELPYAVVSPALVPLDGRYVPRSLQSLARVFIWQGYARLPRGLQHMLATLRSRVRSSQGFSHDLGRLTTDAERGFVRSLVDTLNPDLLVYDSVFNSCGKLGNGERWVITHEVKYQRARSFRESGVAVRPANFDREAERTALSDVDNVIAIQWDDATEFRDLVPEARVIVVPVAIDAPVRIHRDRTVAKHFIFVGSGSYHNYDGIRWFLDACWPLIRSAIPDATLDVVGTVCYRLGEEPLGARFCGVIEDVSSAYERASLAIVPLRIGSGLKVKLVEALAHGLPVVTTTVGAQGLAGFAPLPFALADAAEAFAAQCIAVVGSPERRAELSSLALSCAERFTSDRAFADFADATGANDVIVADESPRVIVVIPTFRRPQLLRDLLTGLRAQRLTFDARSVRAIVIDNDPARSAEAVVREMQHDFPFALEYASMVEPGLSAIRNYALDIARGQCDFLAMIDDDETPEPHWLDELLRVQRRYRTEAVVGPVEPVLPATAPDWISAFHAQQVPNFPDGTLLTDGWSGNCLLHMRRIEEIGVSFDPTMNFAGGEDQLFFRQLLASGGRIAYASRAMAWEDTPPERQTVRFIMLRSFRRGNTLTLCDLRLSQHRATRGIRALKGVALIGKGVFGAANAGLRRDFSKFVARASDVVTGAGMLAGLFGMTYQAYRRYDEKKVT